MVLFRWELRIHSPRHGLGWRRRGGRGGAALAACHSGATFHRLRRRPSSALAVNGHCQLGTQGDWHGGLLSWFPGAERPLDKELFHSDNAAAARRRLAGGGPRRPNPRGSVSRTPRNGSRGLCCRRADGRVKVAIADDSALMREGRPSRARGRWVQGGRAGANAVELMQAITLHQADVVAMIIRCTPTHTDEGRSAPAIREAASRCRRDRAVAARRAEYAMELLEGTDGVGCTC